MKGKLILMQFDEIKTYIREKKNHLTSAKAIEIKKMSNIE